MMLIIPLRDMEFKGFGGVRAFGGSFSLIPSGGGARARPLRGLRLGRWSPTADFSAARSLQAIDLDRKRAENRRLRASRVDFLESKAEA